MSRGDYPSGVAGRDFPMYNGLRWAISAAGTDVG